MGLRGVNAPASDIPHGQVIALDPNDAPPVGTPGTWTLFTHFLGGDDILVEGDVDTALRFVSAVLGMALDQQCECEAGCGLLWDLRDGSNPDGSFPARPVTAHEEQGRRYDGTARTAVYSAAQVLAALPVP